jgi:hypothetical protein
MPRPGTVNPTTPIEASEGTPSLSARYETGEMGLSRAQRCEQASPEEREAMLSASRAQYEAQVAAEAARRQAEIEADRAERESRYAAELRANRERGTLASHSLMMLAQSASASPQPPLSPPSEDTSTSEYCASAYREKLLEELRTNYGERAVSDVEVSRPDHWVPPVKGASRNQKVNPLPLIRLPDGLTGNDWDEQGAAICGAKPRAVAEWRRGFVEKGMLERRRSGQGFRYYRTEKGEKDAARKGVSWRLAQACAARLGTSDAPDTDPPIPEKNLPDMDFRFTVARKCGSAVEGTDELDLVKYLMEYSGRTKRQVYDCLRQMEAEGDAVLWQLLPDNADCPRCDALAQSGDGRCKKHYWIQRQVSITERLHWIIRVPLPSRGIWIPEEHQSELEQEEG